MKLNLLPSHIARAQGSKVYFFIALAILLASGFGTYMLIGMGNEAVLQAKAKVATQEPLVRSAMGKSQMADQVMTLATGIARNINMTVAMDAHNPVYIDLYKDVKASIPSFYRINSMSAAPTGPDSCTVNLTGVLKTSQQYADLIAALYQMEGVTSVSRSGFVDRRALVPGLIEEDQIGTPVPPGQSNIPSDPEERLAALVARAAGPSSSFLNTEWGTDVSPKGPIPGWSAVAITLQISGRAIRPPNPRANIDRQTPPSTGGPAPTPNVPVSIQGGAG